MLYIVLVRGDNIISDKGGCRNDIVLVTVTVSKIILQSIYPLTFVDTGRDLIVNMLC